MRRRLSFGRPSKIVQRSFRSFINELPDVRGKLAAATVFLRVKYMSQNPITLRPDLKGALERIFQRLSVAQLVDAAVAAFLSNNIRNASRQRAGSQ